MRVWQAKGIRLLNDTGQQDLRGIMQKIKPLYVAYPESKQRSISAVFEDFPFFGYRAKVRRSLESQLKQREAFGESLKKHQCWKTEETAQIANAIADVVAEECCWPNALFLPDDPMRLLLWVRSADMEVAGVLIGISRKFNIPVDMISCGESSLFGDVLKSVCEHAGNHD